MIWKEKRTLLAVLGFLLFANTVFFFTYRVQYTERLDALDERLEQSEAALLSARNERIGAERQLAAYRKVEHDVHEVYDGHWSTQAERLGPMISEVRRLTVASSLVPRSYNFSQAVAAGGNDRIDAKRAGLDANEVSIAFQVEGTYDQVRRLINLLELSNQFVIVEQLALTSTPGQTLNVTLNVKTIFRGAPADSSVTAMQRL